MWQQDAYRMIQHREDVAAIVNRTTLYRALA
jgi:hypothetical protein